MQHFFEGIQGWFDFDDVYSHFVSAAKDGDVIVEVGAWLGRSTAYLAVELFNSGKQAQLHVVDTWRGSLTEAWLVDFVNQNGGDIFPLFCANMPPEVFSKLIVHRKDTLLAAQDFEDSSIDFLFLDSAHTTEHVYAEIHAWLPKIKRGGTIAGHDYTTWGPVRLGVDQALTEIGLPITAIMRTSWLLIKPDALPT